MESRRIDALAEAVRDGRISGGRSVRVRETDGELEQVPVLEVKLGESLVGVVWLDGVTDEAAARAVADKLLRVRTRKSLLVACEKAGLACTFRVTRRAPTLRQALAPYLQQARSRRGVRVYRVVPPPLTLGTQRSPATPGSAARPREKPSRSRARARSPGGDDDGPEPPLLAARSCAGCGESFQPKRRAQQFCSAAPCRRARRARNERRRHRAAVAAAASLVPEELLDLARLARDAIREGADPALTLSVVIWPPLSEDEARVLLVPEERLRARLRLRAAA
jgi:hypothetical protein